MSGTTSIRVTDRGFAEAMRDLKALMSNAEVRIGFLASGKAQEVHEGTDLPLVAIAAVHEFGATIDQAARDGWIKREKVMQDRTTRAFRGGRFVKTNKPGYDTKVRFSARRIVIPERSFLRSTIDRQRDLIARAWIRVLRKAAKGDITLDQALAQMGAFAVTLIQKTIRAGIAPPLARSTVKGRAGGGKGKGGDTPLWDTGQLAQGITFQVVR